MKKGVYTLKKFPAARAKWSNLNGGLAGGDASENGDFQSRKRRLQGYNFFRGSHFIFRNRGDDATENVNFQTRKQRLQGAKISS